MTDIPIHGRTDFVLLPNNVLRSRGFVEHETTYEIPNSNAVISWDSMDPSPDAYRNPKTEYDGTFTCIAHVEQKGDLRAVAEFIDNMNRVSEGTHVLKIGDLAVPEHATKEIYLGLLLREFSVRLLVLP